MALNLWFIIVFSQQILHALVFCHTFEWTHFPGDSPRTKSFGDHLQESTNGDDFFYLFTGDTQVWHKCTTNNDGCHREVTCSMFGNEKEVTECTKRMSEYSNRVQQASMAGLKQLISNRVERQPCGVVINGDLTEYGHDDEFSRFKYKWSDWTELKIYPGLGNHDYANNVDDCTFQNCANRMLRYLKSYVSDTLKLAIDVRGTKKYFVQEQYTGSFAYSWDECRAEGKCIHFIQLNNYPTYAKNIDSPFVEWKILKSLNFLKTDLQANVGKSVVVNFHDFDTAFGEQDKREFRRILESYKNVTILALFFAHFHDKVGIRDYWCINGKRIPLMYVGSVPANNYILVRFDPQEGGAMKSLYSIHAENDEQSTVNEIKLRNQSC